MTVRLAAPADAAGVLAIYEPYVRDTAVSFELDVPTVEAMADRIASTLPARPWLVVADDGVILGYAYAGTHRSRAAYQWSVETSVYVAPEARRRGVARALYGALLEVLRRQGFATALAGIAQPNASSVGFHEALGFRPVGVYPAVGFKAGAWHDVGWWTLRLAGDGPPGPLRTVAEVDLAGPLAAATRALGGAVE